MTLKPVLTAALTAVLVCVGVLLPITPASAAGVPPVALPSCSGESSQTGGWLLRDIVSTGTSRTHPAPVRPRNARLGEPCFDDVGFVDPVLMVPVQLSDVPIEGEFDPGVVAVEECATDDPTNCGVFMGYGILIATGAPRLCFKFTGDNSPAQQITVRAGTEPAGGGPTAGGGTVATAKSTFTGGTVSCPPESNAVSSYACGAGTCFEGAAPWEWRYGTTGSANSAWTGDMIAYGSGTPTFGGTQPAQFVFGADTSFSVPDTGEVVCSTDYLATDTIEFELPGHIVEGVGTSAPPPTLDEEGEVIAWTIWSGHYPDGDDLSESLCPYLVSVRFWVCSYVDHDPMQYGCLEVRWEADRFRVRAPYPGPADGPESICALYPNTPGCFDVINPPYIDGTDFDVACAGAPEPTWAVWDWLFPWVGHMLHCLFVPLNGVDRLGWVSGAWERSAGGSLSEVAEAIGNALRIDGGCGLLIDGEVSGSAFQMDTCSWTWAAQGRLLLYWFILITGGLAAVAFIFRSVLAIVNTRMPVPFTEDKN